MWEMGQATSSWHWQLNAMAVEVWLTYGCCSLSSPALQCAGLWSHNWRPVILPALLSMAGLKCSSPFASGESLHRGDGLCTLVFMNLSFFSFISFLFSWTKARSTSNSFRVGELSCQPPALHCLSSFRIIESYNTLSWKGPIRIVECSSWLHTRNIQKIKPYDRALSRRLLNSGSLGLCPVPWDPVPHPSQESQSCPSTDRDNGTEGEGLTQLEDLSNHSRTEYEKRNRKVCFHLRTTWTASALLGCCI